MRLMAASALAVLAVLVAIVLPSCTWGHAEAPSRPNAATVRAELEAADPYGGEVYGVAYVYGSDYEDERLDEIMRRHGKTIRRL